MCGIAGAWVPGQRRDLEGLVRSMADRVSHRGPDGSGTWVDEARGVALGHRRLAVVGLGDLGAQPMVGRSGRWVLTYNGEIYNAPALRTRLEAEGVVFRGDADTEVLVEAIGAWGVRRALAELDGMFAFAVWDREEERLTLARDRLGEKPLVYGQVGSSFAFGSELGSLRAFPGFDASLDPAAVALLLRFKYVPAPWTIHAGARKLPAGHLLEVEGAAPGEPEAYWSLAEVVEAGAQAPIVDERDALERLAQVLTSSVRGRLRSDVPLGAFLSGGIDSSLVATLAASVSSDPLRTFTIGSPDRDHDESSHARAIAARIGAEHTELVVTPAEALAEVPTLAGRWDEPYADSSQLPTLLVSRLARRSVTVALSGDGGDELFGGYNRHLWLPRTWERLDPVPDRLRRGGARILGWPRPGTWDRVGHVLPASKRPRLLGLKVEKFASIAGASDLADAYGRLVSHWQRPEDLVNGSTEPATLAHRRADWPRAASTAEAVMAVDALTYLPDDVLVKVDRASMADALEARVPLLSHHVVELAAHLPLDLKIRGGVGKWCLREVLAQHHPRELFDRPKSGFGVPIAAWLRGPLRPWAEELLAPAELERGGLLRSAPIRAAWQEHLSGRRDRSYELWDVLMLASWRAQTIDA